ncbi:MAG: hypothetical protein WAM79_17490 [Candidatus Sulfotelmatobacter sp.]
MATSRTDSDDTDRSVCIAPYIGAIQSKYVNSNFPWPFYIAEAGWFLRANNYMLGGF